MWVIDSIMYLFSYFLNICILFFRCRERERRCTMRTSTILFSSLSLTDPVQPWSELGKAISYQAAFLHRPPRLCHCVLTSCACAPDLSGLLSHSSNTFFNYSVRVCFENRLCRWVAVCVCTWPVYCAITVWNVLNGNGEHIPPSHPTDTADVTLRYELI